MKQIYFSGNKSNIFKRGLKATLSYSTSALERTMPSLTILWAEKLLCSPTRSKGLVSLEESGFQAHTLSVYGEDVQVYTKGDLSRAIVFVHGWSGAAGNFQAFFEPVLAEGYGVIAFDHVAHGRSSGKYANLFLFILGLRTVLEWARSRKAQVSGIIAHSMGAPAVISGLEQGDQEIPLVFVSPVVSIFENLYSTVSNFGISTAWVSRLIEVIELRHGMTVKKFDPTKRINNIYNPLQVIHDRDDTYIPLEENLNYLPERYRSVVVTEGLGHFRILKAPHVVENAVQFIRNA